MIKLDPARIIINSEQKARRFYKMYASCRHIVAEYKCTRVTALRYIHECYERYPDSVVLAIDHIAGTTYLAVARVILARYLTQEKRKKGNPMFRNSDYQRSFAQKRFESSQKKQKNADRLLHEALYGEDAGKDVDNCPPTE